MQVERDPGLPALPCHLPEPRGPVCLHEEMADEYCCMDVHEYMDGLWADCPAEEPMHWQTRRAALASVARWINGR